MKKIRIKYTTQIPEDLFDKWCNKNKVGRKIGTVWLRDAAIDAAENEINDLVNMVNIK